MDPSLRYASLRMTSMFQNKFPALVMLSFLVILNEVKNPIAFYSHNGSFIPLRFIQDDRKNPLAAICLPLQQE
jgi:hypothetical protein